MLSCEDAHRLIARVADGDDIEEMATRPALDAHLETCAGCRAVLNEQRAVATILRSRPLQSLSPDFARRLAGRLDDVSGWFGIVDARVWTFRLAPVAAVLALVAILGSNSSTSQRSVQTLEDWARSGVEGSGASMLWQQDVNAESLLEMMVTGKTSSATGGAGDVR